MDWYYMTHIRITHTYTHTQKAGTGKKQRQQHHINQFNGNKSIKTGSVSQL